MKNQLLFLFLVLNGRGRSFVYDTEPYFDFYICRPPNGVTRGLRGKRSEAEEFPLTRCRCETKVKQK